VYQYSVAVILLFDNPFVLVILALQVCRVFKLMKGSDVTVDCMKNKTINSDTANCPIMCCAQGRRVNQQIVEMTAEISCIVVGMQFISP
jgi:hypothetical protein